MQPSFKSSLLRSVATVGLVSALAVAAPQAKAAQINSVQNVQISTVADANAPGGQVCRIGQVFNFTFTNNDGFFAGQPRDFVHVAITDINGDPSPAAPGFLADPRSHALLHRLRWVPAARPLRRTSRALPATQRLRNRRLAHGRVRVSGRDRIRDSGRGSDSDSVSVSVWGSDGVRCGWGRSPPGRS